MHSAVHSMHAVDGNPPQEQAERASARLATGWNRLPTLLPA